ncbi:hypothetical protein GGR92_003003 [Spirosoma lacussanchae]
MGIGSLNDLPVTYPFTKWYVAAPFFFVICGLSAGTVG